MKKTWEMYPNYYMRKLGNVSVKLKIQTTLLNTLQDCVMTRQKKESFSMYQHFWPLTNQANLGL